MRKFSIPSATVGNFHLKPQSSGPLYSNTYSWYTSRWWVGCYIWYSEEGTGRAPPRCTKCNSPPINGQCTNFVLIDVALELPLESKGLRARCAIVAIVGPSSVVHCPSRGHISKTKHDNPMILLLYALKCCQCSSWPWR